MKFLKHAFSLGMETDWDLNKKKEGKRVFKNYRSVDV